MCEGIHCPEEKKKNLDDAKEGAHGNGTKASNLQEVGGFLWRTAPFFGSCYARERRTHRGIAQGDIHISKGVGRERIKF